MNSSILYWRNVSRLSFSMIRPLSNTQKSQLIRLTLYTKKNCSLCDEAKETIEELYPNRFTFEEVDITKNKELFRKFKLDIPVFYYNGAFLMQHRANKEALDKLINDLERSNE